MKSKILATDARADSSLITARSPACRPLVSVIVNFLNAETFLQEAIKSVFSQAYDHWELLLVDDGSTDASTGIALRYAQQHPRKVRYLEHPGHQNRGTSASRNLGVRKAAGKYIAMLDSDDIWLPHKLERQVAILESHPEAAMTYGPAEWWYSWSENPEAGRRDFFQALETPPNSLVKPPALLTLFLKREKEVPVPATILVRRDVMEHIGGWEESFRTLYDDQAFYAKLCLRAPVFVESECYCRYRKHPDSLCAVMKRTGTRESARPTFLDWLDNYLSRHKAKNGELSRILWKELWPYRYPILCHWAERWRRLPVQAEELLRRIAARTLPAPARRWLRDRWRGHAG